MSKTFEMSIARFILNKCNIEMLGLVENGVVLKYGVRLRPYGKTAPKGIMAWGYGDTMDGAIEDAQRSAKDGKWLPLDWAYRPWAGAESIGDLSF